MYFIATIWMKFQTIDGTWMAGPIVKLSRHLVLVVLPDPSRGTGGNNSVKATKTFSFTVLCRSAIYPSPTHWFVNAMIKSISVIQKVILKLNFGSKYALNSFLFYFLW